MMNFLLLLLACRCTCLTIDGIGIAKGYKAPENKAGVDEQQYLQRMDPSFKDARYEAVKRLFHPTVHKSNLWWSSLEKSPISDCSGPGAYVWPPNATERARLGARGTRCYDRVTIKGLDARFALDTKFGLESLVVLWNSPPFYTHPSCPGTPALGKAACAPLMDQGAAWEDFVVFVADRYASIKHFVVWNEADDSTWFDPFPAVDNFGKHVEGTPAADVWVDLYARLLVGAHAAVARARTTPAMLYVAIDRQWTSSPWCGDGTGRWGARCPLGAGNLLAGLWSKVGTTIDWSVAVHAYGKPTASDWSLRQPYQAYTFKDLPKVVAFQRDLASRYTATSMPPQVFVAATEQGWPGVGEGVLAQYLCQTHYTAMSTPEILFATHYYFQDTSPSAYGIVPWTAGALLNSESATLAAYAALNPSQWGTNNSNYCCTMQAKGCAHQLNPTQ